MNYSSTGTSREALCSRLIFILPALVLLAGLTLSFFNTLGYGFSSFRAPQLLGWLCAATATACMTAFVKKEKANWAALLFIVFFLLIVIRQGPRPTHALGMALIVLTMACVAQCATIFSRVRGLAIVLAASIVLVATLNALVALYQYFGFSIQYPIPYIEISQKGVAIGQVRQRNQMAILCMLGLITLAYFPIKARGMALTRLGLGVLLITAIAVSASRIGAVAILLFSFALPWTRRELPQSSQLLVGLAFFVFLIFAYGLPLLVADQTGLINRFADDAFAVPCNSRLHLWRNTLSLLLQAPWVGAGWGGFIESYYLADLPSRGCELLDHAHNVYLQVAVEAGLPIALALVFISLWFFVKNWSLVSANTNQRWAYFSVAAIWLYAQTDFPLWETGFLWLFAIFLGINSAYFDAAETGIKQPKALRMLLPISPLLVFAIAIVSASISAIALNQYFRVSRIATSADWENQMATKGYQTLAQENWMFADHLGFIVAQLQKPNDTNANKINSFCRSFLSYSPEPPIIMCVIRSAYLMGDKQQVEFHKQRLHTTFGQQVDIYKPELNNYK